MEVLDLMRFGHYCEAERVPVCDPPERHRVRLRRTNTGEEHPRSQAGTQKSPARVREERHFPISSTHPLEGFAPLSSTSEAKQWAGRLDASASLPPLPNPSPSVYGPET